MSDFDNKDLWKGIILFGLNAATYKMALAKSLLEFSKKERTIIPWDDLSQSFLRQYQARLKKDPRPQQGNPARLTVMERVVRGLDGGAITQASSAVPNRGVNPRPRQPGSSPLLIFAETSRSQPPSGSFDHTHSHSFATSASEGSESGPRVNSGSGSLHLNERGSPLAGRARSSSKTDRVSVRTGRTSEGDTTTPPQRFATPYPEAARSSRLFWISLLSSGLAPLSIEPLAWR